MTILQSRIKPMCFLAPDEDNSGGASTVLDGAIDQTIPDGENFGGDLMHDAEVDAGERQPEPDPAKEAAKAKADKAAQAKLAAEKGGVADPLAAALGDETVAKKETPADPMEEFKDATEGVKSEKIKERITKLRDRLTAEFKAKADIAKELEGLRATAKAGAGAADLQKKYDSTLAENTTLRDSIVALNVEFDPAFREKYINGRASLLQRAANHVKEYGGDADAFQAALALTGKRRTEALKEALADVDEMDKHRITGILTKVEDLDEERAGLQKDPQQAWERLTQSRKVEMEKQQAEAAIARQAVFDKVARELPASSPMLRTIDPAIEGATEWNKQVQTAHETAKRLLSPNANFEEVSAAALKAGRYDHVEAMLFQERKTRLEAEKKLREYEGAAPGPRGQRVPKPKSRAEADLDRPFGEELMALANSGDDE